MNPMLYLFYSTMENNNEERCHDIVQDVNDLMALYSYKDYYLPHF